MPNGQPPKAAFTVVVPFNNSSREVVRALGEYGRFAKARLWAQSGGDDVRFRFSPERAQLHRDFQYLRKAGLARSSTTDHRNTWHLTEIGKQVFVQMFGYQPVEERDVAVQSEGSSEGEIEQGACDV